MKNNKNITVVQKTQMAVGVLAAIVFLVMALKINNGWALSLVGGFALVCLGLASASMWFKAFGVKNPRRTIKKPSSDIRKIEPN